jgi:hypothetical protein
MTFFSFFNLIIGLFKRPTLTHPEEPQDKTRTVNNTDVNAILEKWLKGWSVPVEYWDYWKTKIKINLYDSWALECLALGIKIDTPAYAVEINGGRQLNSLATWFNPGVIAHEQAHNSYALLTDDQKGLFWETYQGLSGNPLIKLLNQEQLVTWGDIVVETHAEIYRYLGQGMPEQLKHFYPKLI